MSNDDLNTQIIVRKRRSDGEEEHHGGVWKLAFADFMTAMMAFFLVMWLINSTSKETKAAIVQYFNPVQLIDANPAHKGLRDPSENREGKSPQKAEAGESGSQPAAQSKSENQSREAALHSEPIKVLDDIARHDPPPRADAENSQTARPASPTFGDPFDRMQADTALSTDHDSATGSPPLETGASAGKRTPSPKIPPETLAADKPHTSAVGLQAELDKIVGQEARGLRGAPHVSATLTEDGLLISLTDDASFSMFKVGSIEPKPQLVRILARIGRILAKQAGGVDIRGHTDGRSYKTSSYDNWRLSSDRATVANYMLLRGGLLESRVRKISGYADRQLKAPKDPLAAVNRRIEILVGGDQR